MITLAEFKKRCILTAYLAPFVAPCVVSLNAQAAETSGGTESARVSHQLEEVIITARRRAQSIQEVPVAVTAINTEQMEVLNIGRPMDLADQIPNVQIEEQFGLTAPRITMRGIVNADFNAAANSPVAVYSDDVVLNSIQDHGFAMFDLERAEVLRGPQGTFFGRNSTTGAIQFISAKPTEELSGKLDLTYGRFDKTRIEAAIAGPLIKDTLLGRISVLKNDSDGHLKNTFTGRNTPKADDMSIRTFLMYSPNEKLDVAFKFQYSKSEGEPIVFHNLIDANPLNGEPGGPASDYRKTPLDNGLRPVEELVDTYLSSLVINYDFGPVTLTSVTGYSEHEYVDINDIDASSDLLLNELFANDQNQFSQEFRLSGNSDSGLDWIAGLYYLTEDVSAQTYFEFPGIISLPIDPTNSFGSGYEAKDSLESYAVFAQGDYRFSDQWSVSAGLRWSRDERDIEHFSDPFFGFDSTASIFWDRSQHTFSSLAVTPPASDSWSAISGKVAIEYRPNSDTLVFASYSRGFKGGSFNGGATSIAEFSKVDPEWINSYELGIKTDILGGLGIFNATAFFYDIEDMQQFSLAPSQTSVALARLLLNIPEARTYGLEIETFLKPIDGLSINLGLGYTETEFTDFVERDLAGNVTNSFNGNDFPGAPKITFNGTVSYDIPVSFGYVIPQVDWSYVDEYFVDIENTKTLVTGGRTYDTTVGDFWDVNLRLGITNQDKSIRATLFVENVSDEIQLTHTYSPALLGGTSITVVRPPRTYGVRFSYEF